MTKTTKKILIPLLAMALVVGGLGVAATSANAATTPSTQSAHTHSAPGVVGTVSAINGTTLTVQGKTGFSSTAVATTYTVDATNAKITKRVAGTTTTAPTTIAVSAIQVGDTVMVRGTVSGTSVTATNIVDGTFTTPSAHNGNRGKGVMGTVASISGNTITVTGKTGPKSTATAVTYTVDATNAKVMKSATSGVKPTTATIADIQVGDTVMVQGTVSGTSVTATSIFDGKFTPRSPGTNPASTGKSVFGRGVVGTVSAVNGNTLTITGKTRPNLTTTPVTYTVDATNAKVTKRVAGTPPTAPTTIAVSAIQVGDTVMVRGTVSGTSVTATNIVDGLMQGFHGKSTSTK